MPEYSVTISETAKTGLKEIGQYIALDNPDRAERFLRDLVGALRKSLSLFPRSCPVARDLELDEEIRVFSYGNYNSYYRVLEEANTIEILYVFNANRDIQALISGH